MKTVRTVVLVVLAVLIASPLMAQQQQGAGKKGQRTRRPTIAALAGIDRLSNLTDEQKSKLAALRKEIGPKVAEATKKLDGILTDEQKKARTEAQQAARAAGKRGAEARAAVEAAVKLTDEQKTKTAEARKALAELTKGIEEKVNAILTDAQKEELKKAREARGTRGGRGNRTAKPATT
ncbi:MAG: hypothetical protein ACYC35_20805 [Pirellulales bacterium]